MVADEAVTTRGARVIVISIFTVVIAESWISVALTFAEISHLPAAITRILPVKSSTVHTNSSLEK